MLKIAGYSFMSVAITWPQQPKKRRENRNVKFGKWAVCRVDNQPNIDLLSSIFWKSPCSNRWSFGMDKYLASTIRRWSCLSSVATDVTSMFQNIVWYTTNKLWSTANTKCKNWRKCGYLSTNMWAQLSSKKCWVEIWPKSRDSSEKFFGSSYSNRKMACDCIRTPSRKELYRIPERLQPDQTYYPFFCGFVWAIDETHVCVKVEAEFQGMCWNRHDNTSLNIMAICDLKYGMVHQNHVMIRLFKRWHNKAILNFLCLPPSSIIWMILAIQTNRVS